MSVPLNYKGAEAFIVMQYERAENKSEIIYSMLGSSLDAVWYVSCCTPTATTLPWQQTERHELYSNQADSLKERK